MQMCCIRCFENRGWIENLLGLLRNYYLGFVGCGQNDQMCFKSQNLVNSPQQLCILKPK